ncbi:MAG: hypothetical protein V7703_20910 [Hyphomicrobiales bacterium]
MSILHAHPLRLPAFLLCLLQGFLAPSVAAPLGDASTSQHLTLTTTGQSIPAGAFGVLTVNRPRQVTLLHLRGIGGDGEVILRGDEPGTCLILHIRFVAGDFGGDSISGHVSTPIRLVINSKRVAETLQRGQDVVSDTYRVSGHSNPEAEIVLQSGLDESFGFVINPGSSILSDIFGVATKSVNCHPV